MRNVNTYRGFKRNEARRPHLDWRLLDRKQGKIRGQIELVGGRLYPAKIDGDIAGTPMVVMLPA